METVAIWAQAIRPAQGVCRRLRGPPPAEERPGRVNTPKNGGERPDDRANEPRNGSGSGSSADDRRVHTTGAEERRTQPGRGMEVPQPGRLRQ